MFYSDRFTFRVLSNWQGAHASFRNEGTQWNKGESVNTSHTMKRHEFTSNEGNSVALIKVAGESYSMKTSQLDTLSVDKKVSDYALPEGGGGRWGGAGLAGGALGRGGGGRFGSMLWDVGAPGWKSTGGPVKTKK